MASRKSHNWVYVTYGKSAKQLWYEDFLYYLEQYMKIGNVSYQLKC